jgi:glycosyltransferase involved in cell wall biosynthesis
MQYLASIVIPAHNEEFRIRSLLQSLTDDSIRGNFAVFVICNGCSDRTREVAEEFAGVTVVTIEDTGKHFALNEGDRLAQDIFPRLYCDADVRIEPSSVSAFVLALSTNAAIVAGPGVAYGIEKRSWGIKKYCQALQSPILSNWLGVHLVGRGLYGASSEARKRFDSFPPLFADDKFFDAQYRDDEKQNVAGCTVTLWVPPTLRQLIRNEARVAKGNQEFASYLEADHANHASTTVAASYLSVHRNMERLRTVREWTKELHRRDWIPMAVYLYVTCMARLSLAVTKARRRQVNWT